jgi:hypothetical protein
VAVAVLEEASGSDGATGVAAAAPVSAAMLAPFRKR